MKVDWIKLKEIAIAIATLVFAGMFGAMFFYFAISPELTAIKLTLNDWHNKCFSNCVIQFNNVINFMEKCKLVCDLE